MNAEVAVRALVMVLFIPALGAVVAHFSGRPSMAMARNGVLPLFYLSFLFKIF